MLEERMKKRMRRSWEKATKMARRKMRKSMTIIPKECLQNDRSAK